MDGGWLALNVGWLVVRVAGWQRMGNCLCWNGASWRWNDAVWWWMRAGSGGWSWLALDGSWLVVDEAGCCWLGAVLWWMGLVCDGWCWLVVNGACSVVTEAAWRSMELVGGGWEVVGGA